MSAPPKVWICFSACVILFSLQIHHGSSLGGSRQRKGFKIPDSVAASSSFFMYFGNICPTCKHVSAFCYRKKIKTPVGREGPCQPSPALTPGGMGRSIVTDAALRETQVLLSPGPTCRGPGSGCCDKVPPTSSWSHRRLSSHGSGGRTQRRRHEGTGWPAASLPVSPARDAVSPWAQGVPVCTGSPGALCVSTPPLLTGLPVAWDWGPPSGPPVT